MHLCSVSQKNVKCRTKFLILDEVAKSRTKKRKKIKNRVTLKVIRKIKIFRSPKIYPNSQALFLNGGLKNQVSVINFPQKMRNTGTVLMIQWNDFFQAFFRKSTYGGSSLALSLASGQINQVQFAHSDVALSVLSQLTAFHCDDEDGMRTTRVLIHIGGSTNTNYCYSH